MITTLETLTIAGWHPDAGLWPLLLVAIGAAVGWAVMRVLA